VIGSLIGLAAGWFLHNQTLVANLEKRIGGTKLILIKHYKTSG
jgi:hypothetical protein